MKRILFSLLAIAAIGCNESRGGAAGSDATSTSTTSFANNPAPQTGTTKASGTQERTASKADHHTADTAADNTGKNKRDRDMKTLTSGDQGEGEVDRTITQHVRKGVVDEYGVTASAANVKIITVDRVVTLRGPVDSEGEKSAIESIARRVDRVVRVDNQLEVASQ